METLPGSSSILSKNWDTEQAIRYIGFLYAHFEALAKGEDRTKVIFGHREDLRMSRCQKHVIFHQERGRLESRNFQRRASFQIFSCIPAFLIPNSNA